MGIIIGICDNEDKWRNQILECIMEYASDCQQKIEYRMYASAEEYLQAERHADILLLEAGMTGMSGIELKEGLDWKRQVSYQRRDLGVCISLI